MAATEADPTENEKNEDTHTTEISSSPPPPPAPRPLPRWQEISAITILCLSMFLTLAGLGQSIAPLHIVGEEFGATNPAQLSWYAAAFSLTAGTFILVAGRWGDVYGHRLMVIIGWSWYALASLLAGFSVYSGQILFCFFRAMQGIGAAIVLPNSIAILGNMNPPGLKKNLIFSLFGAGGPNGFVVGACFASIFAQLTWWPWAYWTLGMVCGALALLAAFVIPDQDSDSSKAHEKGSLDPWGSITGISGLVLFNVAWNQGPGVGWDTPYTYVLLILGSLLLGLFFFLERRVSHPLIPIRELRAHTLWVLACIGCGWSSFGIWLYYTFQFSEVLRGYSPLAVTAQFVPCGISGLVASFTTSYLLGRIGADYIMFLSMIAFMVGIVLIATAPIAQVYWTQTFICTLIMPWGMDLSFPSGMVIMSNATSRKHQGIAASLMNTVVNYSISIGLGFGGTVDAYVNSGGKDLLRGYRGAYYMGIGLAALGVVVSLLFIVSQRLSKPSPLGRKQKSSSTDPIVEETA